MRFIVYLLSVTFCGLMLQAERTLAETYNDPIFGFRITAPESWQTLDMDDGADRAFQMQSPDGNAFGEVRAVHLLRGVTLDDLRQAFVTNAFPEAVLVGSQPETLANLPGEVSAWTVTKNGQDLIIGGFFAKDGPVGYILWTATAREDYNAYSKDFDGIFNTFVRGSIIKDYADKAPAMPPDTRTPGQVEPHDQSEHFQGLVAEAHPELGFVFVRYDAWHPDQPAPYSLRVGLMEYPAHMRPSIVIEALSGEAYPSLEAGAEDLKAQLGSAPGIRFDQEGPHRIQNMSENGVPMQGWSFGATYMHQDVPFRQLTFLFKRTQPGVYYAIYVTGPQEILMRHQPEMMRMLQAIQIVPFQ